VIARAFVGQVDDTARKLPQKMIPHLAAEKKLFGVTVQEEPKSGIEPRPTKQFEIREGLFEVKGREHREAFVELFHASAVIEKKQTVHKRAFALRDENTVSINFGLQESMRGGGQGSGSSHAVIGDSVEDDVFARARGEIVERLEGLVGDAVVLEGRVKADHCVMAKSIGHAIAVDGRRSEGPGVHPICNQPYAALAFQAMKQVRYRAAAFILRIEVANFLECE